MWWGWLGIIAVVVTTVLAARHPATTSKALTAARDVLRALVFALPAIAACATDPLSGPEEPINYAASDACSVSPQAKCPADHTCVVATLDGDTTCASAGSTPLGGPCSISSDCSPGLACFDTTCRAFCREPSDCDGDAQACLGVLLNEQPVKNWNVCSLPCDPGNPQSADAARGTFACPEGRSCLDLYPDLGPMGSTDCFEAGEGREHAPCEGMIDCAPGFVCLNDAGSPSCRRLCMEDASSCTCLSFGQPFYATIAGSITEFGYCQ
jgi:hypothetical protein